MPRLEYRLLIPQGTGAPIPRKRVFVPLLLVVFGLLIISLILPQFYSGEHYLLKKLRFSEYYNQSDKGNLWEEPTLLNLTNFKWLVNNGSRCEQPYGTTKRLIPVLVHTARDHFNERAVIRKSYISVGDIYNNWDVRPVFLMGDVDEKKVNNITAVEVQRKGLDAEQQMFGDLVIGNFIDTYRNLSYKHLMGYKWILQFCQNAFQVMKTDDDLFIDILSWFDWINEDIRNVTEKNSTFPDFYCMEFAGTKPLREEKYRDYKWYVPREEWSEEYYPTYCSGHAYGITIDAIRKIYSVSIVKSFLWVDDAYVTGILRRDAERKYRWKAVLRDLWIYVTGSDGSVKDWRPFCEENATAKFHWNRRKTFKSILHIPRQKFDRDMMCLWKKSVYDRKVEKVAEMLNKGNDPISKTLLVSYST